MNVMWRCGEQGLKIGRQGPDNFTEHDFYMAKNRASLRATLTHHILSLHRKILELSYRNLDIRNGFQCVMDRAILYELEEGGLAPVI